VFNRNNFAIIVIALAVETGEREAVGNREGRRGGQLPLQL